MVQLERIWYLRYRKPLCFTLRIIAAILPPVTEHLDWMETDTGCGRHRETVHYIRRGSYLEVGNGALRYSRFFVRREQRPIVNKFKSKSHIRNNVRPSYRGRCFVSLKKRPATIYSRGFYEVCSNLREHCERRIDSHKLGHSYYANCFDGTPIIERFLIRIMAKGGQSSRQNMAVLAIYPLLLRALYATTCKYFVTL